MGRRSKFSFNFDEMLALAERIEKAGGSLQEACDKALTQTSDYITRGLQQGIKQHVRSGETQGSLRQSPSVRWESELVAFVDIGFDLDNGGIPSIFLMWGTPKMAADAKLKNAAFGGKVKKDVARIQQEALQKFLDDLGG